MNDPVKRKPKTYKRQRVAVYAHHIYWLMGLLMARERRHFTWIEFAKITGIPERYLRHIRERDRAGGAKTVNRLLTLRERGLMIHPSDFVVDETKPLPWVREGHRSRPSPKVART